MADFNDIDKKLDLILQKQQELENKMNKMESIINKIENDIYMDEAFDFEIVCPYCNYEFIVDIDESKTEIECPECSNVIELDWSGDTENDLYDQGKCQGNCHGCRGCMDEDDDM